MTDLRCISVLLAGASLFLASAAGGGTISGTVRSFVSGQPAASVVYLHAPDGSSLDSFVANDGQFEFSDLAAGGYHLSANGLIESEGLAVEFWPDVICFTATPCNLGQLVNVEASGSIQADFMLDTLGSITGRVIDAETGEPVGGGQAISFFRSKTLWGSDGAHVDAAGQYQIVGMTPGTWRLVSRANPAHVERVYGGGFCEPTCNPWEVDGTTLIVQLNQPTPVADLEVPFGPGLAGWARREGDAAAGLAVDIFDENGDPVATVATAADGRFRTLVAPGTYYLATNSGAGFVDQVFSQVPCPNGPASQGLCDPLKGDPVVVVGNVPATDGIFFDLAATSSIFRDGFESGDLSAWPLVSMN